MAAAGEVPLDGAQSKVEVPVEELKAKPKYLKETYLVNNNLKQLPQNYIAWRWRYHSILAQPIMLDDEVAYILVLFREQGDSFDKLHWFESVENKYTNEIKALKDEIYLKEKRLDQMREKSKVIKSRDLKWGFSIAARLWTNL